MKNGSNPSYPSLCFMKKINFTDVETFKRLEQQAYDGTLDITQFPPAEYKYFDTMAAIGYRRRHEGLPKDLCKEARETAYKDYVEAVAERNSRLAVMREYQKNIKRSDKLRCDISKADSRDEKLKLALRCIEMMTGEEGFERRNLK